MEGAADSNSPCANTTATPGGKGWMGVASAPRKEEGEGASVEMSSGSERNGVGAGRRASPRRGDVPTGAWCS